VQPAHQHSATYASRHHVITGEKERNFTQVNPYFASAVHRRRVFDGNSDRSDEFTPVMYILWHRGHLTTFIVYYQCLSEELWVNSWSEIIVCIERNHWRCPALEIMFCNYLTMRFVDWNYFSVNGGEKLKNGSPFGGVCYTVYIIRCYYELHCKEKQIKEK